MRWFITFLLKLSLGEKIDIPKMKTAKQVSLRDYLVSTAKFGGLKFSDTKYKSYLNDPLARLIQVIS